MKGRYRVSGVTPGTYRAITVALTLGGRPAPGTTRNCLIQATSLLNTTRLDVVGAALRAK